MESPISGIQFWLGVIVVAAGATAGLIAGWAWRRYRSEDDDDQLTFGR